MFFGTNVTFKKQVKHEISTIAVYSNTTCPVKLKKKKIAGRSWVGDTKYKK